MRRGLKPMTIRVEGRSFTYMQPGWWCSFDDPDDQEGQLVDEDNQIAELARRSARVLARGEALISAEVPDKACAEELAAAEATARNARLGTWAHTSVIKNAESPGDILARIGQFAVVEGRVSSVREAGGTVYLNFGRRWTRDFAATISRRMMPSFEAAGVVPKSFENRRIRVRGWVERRGGPRIEVLRTGQIEVVGD